jgi:hypothetical protein
MIIYIMSLVLSSYSNFFSICQKSSCLYGRAIISFVI